MFRLVITHEFHVLNGSFVLVGSPESYLNPVGMVTPTGLQKKKQFSRFSQTSNAMTESQIRSILTHAKRAFEAAKGWTMSRSD